MPETRYPRRPVSWFTIALTRVFNSWITACVCAVQRAVFSIFVRVVSEITEVATPTAIRSTKVTPIFRAIFRLAKNDSMARSGPIVPGRADETPGLDDCVAQAFARFSLNNRESISIEANEQLMF
ncbi:hypothetical protein AEGHOMDF_5662 [Methylobacterium soli]|nr:hypothetical protein AEGHOMDF_5662 [Methylobacterium soli]